jgi:hypothetical protein
VGSRVEVKYEEGWFPAVVTAVNVHGYTVKTTQDDDTQIFASFLDPVCVCAWCVLRVSVSVSVSVSVRVRGIKGFEALTNLSYF